MRTGTINHWMSIISSEKNENSNIRQPQSEEELALYRIAEFYVSNEDSSKTKLVA